MKTEFIQFSSLEGQVLLMANFFRGIVYAEHIAGYQNSTQENRENSVEISKLDLKKKGEK